MASDDPMDDVDFYQEKDQLVQAEELCGQMESGYMDPLAFITDMAGLFLPLFMGFMESDMTKKHRVNHFRNYVEPAVKRALLQAVNQIPPKYAKEALVMLETPGVVSKKMTGYGEVIKILQDKRRELKADVGKMRGVIKQAKQLGTKDLLPPMRTLFGNMSSRPRLPLNKLDKARRNMVRIIPIRARASHEAYQTEVLRALS